MKLRHGFCRQSLRLISFATSLYTREAFASRRPPSRPKISFCTISTKFLSKEGTTHDETLPAGSYDIAVIGAGHAGIEAALAAARLGCRTIIFTISLDAIGNMPCNPSIGGTAKGHLVRELDALGGEMAKAADATMLQSRMLNLGKGPAVHSLRLQCDRKRYHMHMKAALENQPNLSVRQAEIVSIDTDGAGEITSVTTAMGGVYSVRAVILATGTFLRGKIFVGEYSEESGPDGMHPAARLSDSLRALGIPLRRFKTGTPARVHGNSVDFTRLEEQHGDEPPVAASFATDPATLQNKLPCYIGYTNEETHEVIRQNIGRSPLYGGAIEGIGPRHCPSIEDKVMRFAEKPRHQFFLEPMGEEHPGDCTSPACPAPSRRRCRPPFTVPSPGWSRWSSCAPPTPSNTIASTPPISKILCSLRRCPIFMVPASSMHQRL